MVLKTAECHLSVYGEMRIRSCVHCHPLSISISINSYLLIFPNKQHYFDCINDYHANKKQKKIGFPVCFIGKIEYICGVIELRQSPPTQEL